MRVMVDYSLSKAFRGTEIAEGNDLISKRLTQFQAQQYARGAKQLIGAAGKAAAAQREAMGRARTASTTIPTRAVRHVSRMIKRPSEMEIVDPGSRLSRQSERNLAKVGKEIGEVRTGGPGILEIISGTSLGVGAGLGLNKLSSRFAKFMTKRAIRKEAKGAARAAKGAARGSVQRWRNLVGEKPSAISSAAQPVKASTAKLPAAAQPVKASTAKLPAAAQPVKASTAKRKAHEAENANVFSKRPQARDAGVFDPAYRRRRTETQAFASGAKVRGEAARPVKPESNKTRFLYGGQNVQPVARRHVVTVSPGQKGTSTLAEVPKAKVVGPQAQQPPPVPRLGQRLSKLDLSKEPKSRAAAYWEKHPPLSSRFSSKKLITETPSDKTPVAASVSRGRTQTDKVLKFGTPEYVAHKIKKMEAQRAASGTSVAKPVTRTSTFIAKPLSGEATKLARPVTQDKTLLRKQRFEATQPGATRLGINQPTQPRVTQVPNPEATQPGATRLGINQPTQPRVTQAKTVLSAPAVPPGVAKTVSVPRPSSQYGGDLLMNAKTAVIKKKQ